MLSRLLTRKEQAVLLAVAGALLTGSAAVFWRGAAAPAPVSEHGAVLAAASAAAPPAAPSRAPIPPIVRPEETPAIQAVSPPAAAAEAELTVQVRGAVRRPGVFAFAPGSRVEDAIRRAGGVTDEADVEDVNLAAPLMDRAALTIPLRPRRESVGETLVIRRGERARDVNPAEYTLSGWRAAAAPAAVAPPSTPGAAGSTGGGLIDLNRATKEQLETLPGIGPKLAGDIIAHRGPAPFQRIEDLMNVTGIGQKRFDAVKELVTVSGR